MKEQIQILLAIATSDQEFRDGRNLFEQYAKSLVLDLTYQDFTGELNSIAVQYNKPQGALVLAYDGEVAIGCTGIRKFDDDTAELKRMFVQENYRGHWIAQRMLVLAIEKAKQIGYRKIRLDTLPGMKEAQRLYRALGFYEIASYRFSPVEGTIFMEKILS